MVIDYIKTGQETSACLDILQRKGLESTSLTGQATSPRMRQYTMNGQIKKLEEQNEYLRKAYIRMSKGRTYYEAGRLRYKTLNAQMKQTLEEMKEDKKQSPMQIVEDEHGFRWLVRVINDEMQAKADSQPIRLKVICKVED